MTTPAMMLAQTLESRHEEAKLIEEGRRRCDELLLIATRNNIGPCLAAVGPVQNFSTIPEAGKWLPLLCMVMGWLELFAILVLFVPSFWRGR